MRKFNIDFNKTLKPVLIAYVAIFVIGILWSVIFGVKLDINFSGGAKVSYSYTGEIADKDIEAVVDQHIKKDYALRKSTSLAGDTQTFEISLSGKNALSAKTQEAMTKALTEKFKDNKIELYDSNSVSPSVAGSSSVGSSPSAGCSPSAITVSSVGASLSAGSVSCGSSSPSGMMP